MRTPRLATYLVIAAFLGAPLVSAAISVPPATEYDLPAVGELTPIPLVYEPEILVQIYGNPDVRERCINDPLRPTARACAKLVIYPNKGPLWFGYTVVNAISGTYTVSNCSNARWTPCVESFSRYVGNYGSDEYYACHNFKLGWGYNDVWTRLNTPFSGYTPTVETDRVTMTEDHNC